MPKLNAWIRQFTTIRTSAQIMHEKENSKANLIVDAR